MARATVRPLRALRQGSFTREMKELNLAVVSMAVPGHAGSFQPYIKFCFAYCSKY